MMEHPKYKPMRWELQGKATPDGPFDSIGRAPEQAGLFRAAQEFLHARPFQTRELDDAPEADKYIEVNGTEMPLANRARKAKKRKVDVLIAGMPKRKANG